MGSPQNKAAPGGWPTNPITIDELNQHYSTSWNPDSIAGKFTVDEDTFLIDRVEINIVNIFPEGTLEVSNLSDFEETVDRLADHPFVRRLRAKSPYRYALSLNSHPILNSFKGEIKYNGGCLQLSIGLSLNPIRAVREYEYQDVEDQSLDGNTNFLPAWVSRDIECKHLSRQCLERLCDYIRSLESGFYDAAVGYGSYIQYQYLIKRHLNYIELFRDFEVEDPIGLARGLMERNKGLAKSTFHCESTSLLGESIEGNSCTSYFRPYKNQTQAIYPKTTSTIRIESRFSGRRLSKLLVSNQVKSLDPDRLSDDLRPLVYTALEFWDKVIVPYGPVKEVSFTDYCRLFYALSRRCTDPDQLEYMLKSLNTTGRLATKGYPCRKEALRRLCHDGVLVRAQPGIYVLSPEYQQVFIATIPKSLRLNNHNHESKRQEN